MYRAPQKQNAVKEGSDFEQTVQAYNQGYEARRLGKPYINPWRRTQPVYDALGYAAKTQYLSWEDELNMWFYNGYYDWTPGDWVPYLADEQQNDYAVNPKTNKARKSVPKANAGQWPKEAWATTATFVIDVNANLNPVVAA